MKKLISFYILLFLTVVVKGQQVSIHNQYMFNKFLLNPAMAGAEGFTSVTVTSRIQWLSFKDAPITNSINAQTRLLKKTMRLSRNRTRWISDNYGNVGIGINVFSNHQGLLDQTGVELTYAYHIRINKKSQLSFGLTSSFTDFRVDRNKMQLYEPDNYLNTNTLSVFIPDFNAGVYFATQESYLGVSANRILNSTIRVGSIDYNKFKLVRNYNIMGGYRFAVDKNWGVEPSFFFKTTERLSLSQFDISCRTYYKRDFWAGIGVRSGSALTTNIGLRWNKLFFGYAYDFTLNRLQTYSAGTHEFIITFKIGENVWKYKWLEKF